MSRELKFRIWDSISQIYLDESDEPVLEFMHEQDGIVLDYDNYSDERVYTIEQFTSLVDKNGKEIFENDLIKAVGKNVVDDTLSVVFKNGAFCLKLGQESQPFFNDDYNMDFTLSHLEVIGNIHENGDLLK